MTHHEGATPKLQNIVHSSLDNTVKYVFVSGEQLIEFSYIDKQDGKDILCVSTQTGCSLGCTFCFLTDYELKVRSLEASEIVQAVDYIAGDLKLLSGESDVLLISYMGCGEPLLNLDGVFESARQITKTYGAKYRVVRFAVATLIPHPSLMEKFISAVKEEELAMKLHLSLHSPDEVCRSTMMPSAHSIQESIGFVEKFMRVTGNSSEIHYSLIDDVNDRESDLEALIGLLKDRHIPIKFLIFNEKPSVDRRRSQRVAYFRDALEQEGIRTEFYIPPGRDVGSSCGQFLMDYYAEYAKK